MNIRFGYYSPLNIHLFPYPLLLFIFLSFIFSNILFLSVIACKKSGTALNTAAYAGTLLGMTFMLA